MSTVPLRKARAGSDSYGHVWPEDGVVVDVDYEQALVLLAIPDGGFTVAEDQPEVTEPDPGPELSEVAPDPEPDASDTPPAKKTARRRATQS
jgi:hypothetical protein